jgi:hypothetical protein
MANSLNSPKLTIQIEGKNKVRDLYQQKIFEPVRVFENTLDLNEVIDWVSIYPSSLQVPIRQVIVEAPILDESLELPYTVELKTTVSQDVTGSVEFVEEIEAITIKSYSESFGSKILDIQVRCSAPEDNTKTISARVHAWEN